jgi:two-component system, LuxR family, sensor kinase FixL
MSWITVVWSINVGACLTLAAFYCAVWCKQRENWVHLLFSCSAIAVAAIAAFELAMVHAETVGRYEELVRWVHVPTWLLIVSFVIFVRLYLHAGRPWLAWSICGLRTLVLILNFIFTPGINFRAITSLHQFSWGGEIISVPIGVANPWGLLSSVSLLLLLIFFVDATITAWRRGDRQRALVVGGSMIFGAILAWHVPLVIWGVIEVPFFLGFTYTAIVAAMGYELSNDMAQAAHLARQLQASEATLRESKERIDLATKAAGLVVWTWDIPRDEVWLSDKDRALFGFSQWEKLNAERIRSTVHPEDRHLVRQLRKDALTTREEIETEYRVVLPDGKVRWVRRRGRVEFDAEGKPFWERGVLMDITERKQAEEKFRLVVESAPNAMIMVDAEGRITLVNTQAEAVFGYARKELIGRPIEMLVPERLRSDHIGDWHGYFCDAWARPIGAGREFFARRKDGSEIPIEIGLNPIQTSEGLLVLASIVDISERKQAELEAARQRHDLAHLARVNTLGELSSSLAHELTHPVTAILSNAQAAQRFLDADEVDLNEVREILNDIVTEDQRAGEVIHRLRRLLRKGEPAKHCDDVDLNEVIRDVLRLMRSDLINQNVTVHTDLAQNLPSVTGDQVQLQQVVLNLVMNGCEAMADYDSSQRQLLIASKSENGTVLVSVTDRGGGIQEEKPEQVFERFFTTKKEGMGLGLSICRTIIKAHRGEIWATNNAHCGATFHFSLPIVRSDALSAASPKVLDGSALTATGASAPRAAAPSVVLRAGANGLRAEELTVSASSDLLERRQ